MDTLTSINVFRQVVESGSFIGAAERLDLSPGSVSKHVMSVEKRLGVKLLNRNTRNLSVTELGRHYLERCKRILQDLEQTELELESMSSAPRGTLRIACCTPGAWFAGVLTEYRRRWPEVVLDISFVGRAVNLVAEDYDLALRLVHDEPLPSGVVARRVRSVPFRIAASLDYIKCHGMPKTPEDLRRHDVITTGDLDSFRIECPQGTTEIPVRSALRCLTLADVAIAVATGMGLGVLPAALFSDSAFANVLTPVLTEFHVKESSLYVLYADRKYLPFKVRAFINLVLESGARNQEPSTKRPAKQETGCTPPSRAPVSHSETLHTSPADCSPLSQNTTPRASKTTTSGQIMRLDRTVGVARALHQRARLKS
jgi:DNA-binding transcriptional LysR family regulator